MRVTVQNHIPLPNLFFFSPRLAPKRLSYELCEQTTDDMIKLKQQENSKNYRERIMRGPRAASYVDFNLILTFIPITDLSIA